MAVRTYRLFTTIAQANGPSVNVQMLRGGRIRQARYSVSAAPTAAMEYAVEISKQSDQHANEHDGVEIIDQVVISSPIATGLDRNVAADLDVPVTAGERVYLHSTNIGGGAVTGNVHVFLDVAEGGK